MTPVNNKDTVTSVNGWEQEFDKQFKKPVREDIGKFFNTPNSIHTYFDNSDIKAFIKSLLSSRDEELIRKIEGMEFVDTNQAGQFRMHADGYNQAIEEVIHLIKNQ